METSNEENHETQETTIPILPEGPEGIGGWLILIVIGLIVTPIRSIYCVFSDLVPLLNASTIDLSNYSGLTSLIYLEIIGNLVFAVFSIFLVFFIFTKHRLFPRLIIIFLLANFVFIVLDFILANQIPLIQQSGMDDSTIKELIRSLAGAAIWVPYFIFSKRVKNTFIK